MIGDVREGGVVLDRGVGGALVGGDEGGAVGPVLRGVGGLDGVGGGVDGEDDVDVAVGLDEGVEGDVLEVFAAVDEGEAGVAGAGVGAVVVAAEGVGGVICDVVVGFVEGFEDGLDGGFEDLGGVGAVELEDELVEEGGAGAHDEAAVVEADDALFVVGEAAVGEVRADVLQRCESVECRVEAAHLVGVEFDVGGVERKYLLSRGSLKCNENRERRVRIAKIRVVLDGAPCVARSSIGSIHKLERKSATPVIGK